MKITSLIIGATALALSITTHAYEAKDMIVRVGLAQVSPDESSNGVVGSNGLGLVTQTDGVAVDDDTSVGIGFTYMLTPEFGLEVLGALPFSHKITGTGALEGLAIAETKHLPPTISAQYYPAIGHREIQPYIGLGINYTVFFDEETNSALLPALQGLPGLSGIQSTDIELEDSTGLAFQVGIDFKLSDKFVGNVAIWNIDIETEADVIIDGATARTVDVKIDPWVYMLSVGYKL